MGYLGGATIILSVLGIVLGLFVAVLWIALPFAVFGIKPRLDQINKNLANISSWLKYLAEHTDASGGQLPGGPQVAPPQGPGA
ncbi:MAG: hypothetical protein JXR96_18050 [Deltaproteobacteria bacterium]|nr:hypothetical protein [Deltaproteobacteria bacterium]